MKETVSILAVSGSLRASSYNTQIVHAIRSLFPLHVAYVVYDGIGSLPHFDGSEDAPLPVTEWRKEVERADGVLICSPEYAFGVPGSFKNALDWTVSSGEFTYKPVAIITASGVGEKAHASLLNTFTALTANIVEGATLLVPFVRTKLNDKGAITDEDTLNNIKDVVKALITEAEKPTRTMV